MIKGILSAVAFCSVCLIGFFINKNKKKRLEFYKDFYSYVSVAEQSIKDLRLTKSEINKKVSGICHDDFRAFLNGTTLPKYLKQDEMNEILLFFNEFGERDLEVTVQTVGEAKLKAEEKVSVCEKDVNEKGKMIMKLCILGGIALVILLL